MTTNEPSLVSVILPTRNRAHLLPRALQSLRAQTYRHFEVLLIDDNRPGARMSEVPFVRTLLAADGRFRYVPNECPTNAARARNLGLRMARGKWITYLDDDDSYRPTKIEKQVALARRTHSPLVVCGLEYHLGIRRRRKQVTQSEYFKGDYLNELLGATPAMLHLRDTGLFFDERLDAAEDMCFLLDLIRRYDPPGIPNVCEPLVDVFPQPESRRVGGDSARTWAAFRTIYISRVKPEYPAEARRYLARNCVSRYRFRRGGWKFFLRHSIRLFRMGGVRETRWILNSLFNKLPLLHRLVVR